MNNDAPQTLDAAGSRVAELEQQLRLSDEGVSRLAQRCLELEQQVVKYRYYPLGRYLHEQPGKALLRALTVLKEETEAVSRQGTEQLLEANAEIQQLRKQLAEQQQHLADLQNSRAAYEASLENVLASSSWKLTAPLRKLLGLFHRH